MGKRTKNIWDIFVIMNIIMISALLMLVLHTKPEKKMIQTPAGSAHLL